MKLVVNGNQYEHNGEGTISSLLGELQIECTKAAVMVNDSVVKRDQHSSAGLKPGDRVEILTFAAGG
ncbi:unnamed protein product [marine sediment metagenome]|uniref:Thiamine biosynthesis protein ThiS n=1 Tax=marine sediment metagenome TaxID=412755 RepID=X0VKB4_9ZZZZ